MGWTPLVFGEIRLDPDTQSVWRSDRRLALRPKTLAVLHYLIEQRHRLVTKDELLDAVWPDVNVSDSVLKVCIRELRTVLGDDAREPRYIETRHRLGYRFLAPSDSTKALPGAAFVGRRRELRALDDAWSSIRDGRSGPRIVVISGEAGMGKSRLVAEWLHVRGDRAIRICRSACLEQHGPTEALFPLLQGLEQMLPSDAAARHVARRVAPTWCAEMPQLFEHDTQLPGAVAGASQARMLRELATLMRELAADRPLVWVVEDVHWSDASTCDFLRLMGSTAADERFMMILTSRSSAEARNSALVAARLELATHRRSTNLVLENLEPDDVSELVRAAASGVSLAAAWRDLLLARTEGHPLFLTSLLDHLRARGIFQGPMVPPSLLLETIRSDVPSDVQSMVERRLQLLDDRLRAILVIAAVIGERFDIALVAALTSEPRAPLEEQLDRLRRSEKLLLLVEQGDRSGRDCYRFAHALYREHLYGELPPQRRKELHHRVGQAMEAADVPYAPGVLAHHFERAGDAARAIDYLLRATRTAGRRLSVAGAVECCSRALPLVDQLPPPARAMFSARIRGRRAELLGLGPEAEADADTMIALAQQAESAELEIAGRLLRFRMDGYAGRFNESQRQAERALAVARAHDLRHEQSVIRASLASLLGVQGNVRAACDGLSEALHGAESACRATHVPLSLDLASFLSLSGQHERALIVLDTLDAVARDEGDALRIAASYFWRTRIHAHLSRFDQALENAEAGAQFCEANGEQLVAPRLHCILSWLYDMLGDADASSAAAERAVSATQRLVLPDALAHCILNLAARALGRGDFSEASEWLDRVGARLDGSYFGRFHVLTRHQRLSAVHALLRGDVAIAERHARQAIDCSRTFSLPHSEAGAQLLLTRVERARGNHTPSITPTGWQASVPPTLLDWRLQLLRDARALGHTEHPGVRASTMAMTEALSRAAPLARRSAFRARLCTEVSCLER